MQLLCSAIESYFGGEPFEEFKKSMYFDRYLQWKYLERYGMTKKMGELLWSCFELKHAEKYWNHWNFFFFGFFNLDKL